jgi:hypothetical protein
MDNKNIMEDGKEVVPLVCLGHTDLLALGLALQEVAGLFRQVGRSSFFVLGKVKKFGPKKKF